MVAFIIKLELLFLFVKRIIFFLLFFFRLIVNSNYKWGRILRAFRYFWSRNLFSNLAEYPSILAPVIYNSFPICKSIMLNSLINFLKTRSPLFCNLLIYSLLNKILIISFMRFDLEKEHNVLVSWYFF